MTTNREFGEKLLKEAEWIFEKDFTKEDAKKAFEDADFVLKEIKTMIEK